MGDLCAKTNQESACGGAHDRGALCAQALEWSLGLIKSFCGAGSNLRKLSQGLWASRVSLLIMATAIPTVVFAALWAVAAYYQIGHPVELAPLLGTAASLGATLSASLTGMFLLALTLDSPQILWRNMPLIVPEPTQTSLPILRLASIPHPSYTSERPPRPPGVR